MSKSYDELWRMLNVAGIDGKGLTDEQTQRAFKLLDDLEDEVYYDGYEKGYGRGQKNSCFDPDDNC